MFSMSVLLGRPVAAVGQSPTYFELDAGSASGLTALRPKSDKK
jgi:hypothetical protein